MTQVNAGPCAKEHDFMSPVVVKAVEKSFTFIFGGDTVEKEVAVSFCSKCGLRSAYGWGIKNEDDE